MDNKPQNNEIDNSEVAMEEGLENRYCKPWKERDTVERYLSGLTIFLVLIFFALLAVLFRPQAIIYREVAGKKMCTTETCVREAFRLLNNVEFSSDACHNFSELVCNTYQDTIPPYKPLHISDAKDDLLSTVQELLTEEGDSDEMDALKKAKKFYQSCLSAESREQSTGYIVRELLRKAKMTDDHKKNVYNREKTLALLTIYGNKNPFFKFRRTPQIIYLYPGSPVLKSEVLLSDTSEHIRVKYKELVFSTLLKMNISAKSASSNANDMVEFERKFATLAAAAKCTGNTSEVALQEMEDMLPELKWSVIIRYIYGYYGLESDFSQRLTILLTCEDYFRKILRLMAEYGESYTAIETFIMWSFALHYLPVLDQTFRPFYREIEQVVETHWHGNAHDADWKICTYATTHYFNSPVAHLYYEKEHSKETDNEIKALFEDIKLAYEELICAQEWLDEKTATQCKTTIEETELIIGLPSNIRDPELVEAMYSLVNVTDDIMTNLLALDKAIFAENVIGTQLTPLYSTPMDADIYYDHGTLTILIGATIQPVFAIGAPRYFSYGWMGFIIAREMWHAVESFVFPAKVISADEAKELRIMEGCLFEQHAECKRIAKNKLMSTNNGLESVMADQTALLVATEAYMDFAKKNGEEYSVPGLNISNEKLFFLNFGQLMCGSSSENPFDIEDIDLISFNACRLNNILANSQQFLETFSCSAKSTMNNNTECKIWV